MELLNFLPQTLFAAQVTRQADRSARLLPSDYENLRAGR